MCLPIILRTSIQIKIEDGIDLQNDNDPGNSSTAEHDDLNREYDGIKLKNEIQDITQNQKQRFEIPVQKGTRIRREPDRLVTSEIKSSTK